LRSIPYIALRTCVLNQIELHIIYIPPLPQPRSYKVIIADMAKKLVVVTGATGNQGSSVARGLLKTGDWHIRAVTRDACGEKAQKLAAEGMEVVQASYDDEESVRKAFTVSYLLVALFVLTTPNTPAGCTSHLCGHQLVGAFL